MAGTTGLEQYSIEEAERRRHRAIDRENHERFVARLIEYEFYLEFRRLDREMLEETRRHCMEENRKAAFAVRLSEESRGVLARLIAHDDAMSYPVGHHSEQTLEPGHSKALARLIALVRGRSAGPSMTPLRGLEWLFHAHYDEMSYLIGRQREYVVEFMRRAQRDRRRARAPGHPAHMSRPARPARAGRGFRARLSMHA